MKVAFRADGSEEKGLGHLMRCSAIAARFLMKDDSVCFYCTHKTSGLNWLREKGLPAVELGLHPVLLAEAEELNRHLKADQTDILFVDSYWLSDDYITSLQVSGALVVAIDDSALYRYQCDIVINSALNFENQDYSHCKIGRKLLGGRYNILREEFFSMPVAPFQEPVCDILVTLGGSDCTNSTPVILAGLCDIPDIFIHVVYGPLMHNRVEIEAAARLCRGQVDIIVNPLSMAAEMARCGLAISAGGGTVRELLCMGVVPLTLLQADNQMPLGDYFEAQDMPICMGDYRNVTPQTVNTFVLRLMRDTALRLALRNKGLSLLARDGVDNIVLEVKEYFYFKKKEVE